MATGPQAIPTKRRTIMSISVNNKARIIASITVGGFIALIFLAVGCQGDYGIIEEERVSFDPTPSSTIAIDIPSGKTPEINDNVVVLNELPEIVVTPDTVKKVTYKEAEAAFLARNYTEAVELFTLYTKRKNKNAWGFYMLGLSARRAGDLDTAAEALEKATQLDPEHLKSWVNLGRVYLDAKQPAKSINAIDKALMLDTGVADVHRLAGRAHDQLGDLVKAEEAYKKALASNGEDAWAMNNLAFVFLRDDRFDEALPLLALAIQLKADVAVFYNNLGMALESNKHFSDAEAAYGKAVELDAGYTKAFANKERLAGVDEPKGISPVDLNQLAKNQEALMKTWATNIAGRDEQFETHKKTTAVIPNLTWNNGCCLFMGFER